MINAVIQNEKSRYLLWVGFIERETERGREIGYYGKFCKTKNGVIGAISLVLDNASPYKIEVIDTAKLVNPSSSHIRDLKGKYFRFPEGQQFEKDDDEE